MTVINSNVAALRAQNGSRLANASLGTAMERLSTGRRINSAKDDAAGLAISSTMTSQIRGMSTAIRNANDGISLAQTAEGALGEVGNMLQRVRELAVQSKSGTYSASDRTNLQAEVTELSAQIVSILDNTKFNGNALFDTAAAGPGTSFVIQAGSASADTITISIGNIDKTTLAATAGNLNVGFGWRRGDHDHQRRRRFDQGQHGPCNARCIAEPPGIDGQQPDLERHQPVRRTVADRRRRLLG